MFDVIIVGSGPAGTFAAHGLQGKKILILDVGKKPPVTTDLDGNLFEQRQTHGDLFEALIGQSFQTLRNINTQKKVSLKLKSPYTSYIIEESEKLSPLRSQSFDSAMSFAEGGLANAWGAGVYRFTDRDLNGFPISAKELDPFYTKLTNHIGISGTGDDLEPYFGPPTELQAPLSLSKFYLQLLKNYRGQKKILNQSGFHLGFPRLAVLTEDLNERKKYQYQNNEFFKPHIPAIYNPAYTLRDLVKRNLVEYRDKVLVKSYKETSTGVEVLARDLNTQETISFRCAKLLIGAGTLNTTKIVLASNDDTQTKLPILDNPMSCIPLISWRRIGAKLDLYDSSLAQLNFIYDGPLASDIVQASMYGTTGPLRSDIIFDFPLSISANLLWAKYLAPAMGLAMLFYRGEKRDTNYVQLAHDDHLEVQYASEKLGELENFLIGKFRKLGLFSVKSLCQYPKMGSSLHYSSTLPMRKNPKKYETDSFGKLYAHNHVHIIDGACFSALPAKNLTFTIMANAMRIGEYVKKGFS